MIARWLLLALALLLPSALQAQAAPDPAGRWALMADGRVLAILELEHDGQSGWRGGWLRPDRMTISSSHEVFDIAGPVVRRALLSATPRPDGLELSIAGRDGDAPGRFLLRLSDADHAELGWVDPLAIPPIPLVRTGAAATVEPQWAADSHHAITTPYPSNAEMRALFEADQADRRAGPNIDWSVVGPRDAARRARTRALLDAGALRSGDDFWHAAFIFQHGGDSNSYLLAHTLAVIAAARGRPDATWIAAATLDRYLQSIGQKQIYGTQFTTRPGEPATQEPYDRALVSDALREALGVPALAQQAEQARRYDREREAQPAAPRG